MKYISKTLIAVFFSFVTSTCTAFITVGTDADCTYNNFTSAYASGNSEIRVTTQQSLAPFTINRLITLRGGFANCSDANNGIISADLTQWDGNNNQTVLTLDMPNNGIVKTVNLYNFKIFNGRNTSFASAGGINVRDFAYLYIHNSLIQSNVGDEGGGIRLRGQEAKVTLINTQLKSNTANSAGGGIYCENGAEFFLSEESSVQLNFTSGKGGGIFANDSCSVSLTSGGYNMAGDYSLYGVNYNIAEFGGGIYAKNSSHIFASGDFSHPALITENFSTNNNIQFYGGGGVFLTGLGTNFVAFNTYIEGNTATNSGAGFVVQNEAELRMVRYSYACWDNDKCSSISNNKLTSNAGFGGAGVVDNAGVVTISQSVIANNHGLKSAILHIQDRSSVTLEGNLITQNKGIQNGVAQNLFELYATTPLNSSELTTLYNTIVANDAATIFHLKDNIAIPFLKVINSIIRDNGTIMLNDNNALTSGLTFDCDFLHENVSLQGTLNKIFLSPPGFVDAANGDYHLQRFSNAVDICDESVMASAHTDLNGNQRGFDDLALTNLFGAYDVGAYEGQFDVIFKHGFE